MIDTTPLITQNFALTEIKEAYRIYENNLDEIIKVGIVWLCNYYLNL